MFAPIESDRNAYLVFRLLTMILFFDYLCPGALLYKSRVGRKTSVNICIDRQEKPILSLKVRYSSYDFASFHLFTSCASTPLLNVHKKIVLLVSPVVTNLLYCRQAYGTQPYEFWGANLWQSSPRHAYKTNNENR